MNKTIEVYLSLGSNIPPRTYYLRSALNLLEQSTLKIQKISSLYLTSPIGYKKQPSFLNAVVYAFTMFSPLAMLKYIQEIEREFGRKRTIRFGPRTLDIDILIYDKLNLKTDALTLPHPRMIERKFVLVPLLELNSSLKDSQGRAYSELLKRADESQTIRLYRKNWR